MAKISQKLLISLIATGVFVVPWLVLFFDWMQTQVLHGVLDFLAGYYVYGLLYWVVFSLSLPVGAAWLTWALWPERKSNVVVAAVITGVYALWWHWAVFATDTMVWDSLRAALAKAGLGGFFVLGLCWVIWWVERASQYYEAQRASRQEPSSDIPIWQAAVVPQIEQEEGRIWNPLDPHFWAYGRRSRKLNQSMTALISYTILFLAAFIVVTSLGGCIEIYESPAGGGEQATIAQQVKVQKVIRKKFVVNPFSAILFEVPPIEEIKLHLEEITKHAYKVGQGEGVGAGFAAGTKRGKVRFIRLEYAGGDWNQDFGVGADLNILIEYGVRTKHKVAKRTESRRVSQLKNFPKGKSPPMVYLTGQRNISLSKNDVKILREFLLDKHGMLFGDNGGSSHFHNQFLSMMRQVLPKVRPVAVPLDDQIHRVPFAIPFLPYVAPHGGKDALGWKVDGRWVCYYHPGDIGDAWSDGHAGVSPQIWEACFQLGTNVIFYAHAEHSKWLAAQQRSD